MTRPIWQATLAFALYLTHKEMLHLAATLIGTGNDTRLATAALAVALIALAAVILHIAVERPALRLRQRLFSAS